MGLGGHAWERGESHQDLTNYSDSSARAIRDGGWFSNSGLLSSPRLNGGVPSNEDGGFGFRVASFSSSAPPAVPEPNMMVIGTLFGIGGADGQESDEKV